MQVVGRYLQVEAVRLSDAGDKDLFGRSSYNRYYYASFLRVRTLLQEIHGDSDKLPHASYPEFLVGNVARSLKDGRRAAQRAGDQTLVTMCNRAIAATAELARLLRDGYATRVVADYEPDERIVFTAQNRFQLASVDITTAHQWPEMASALSEAIQSAWKQIHG